MHSPISTLARKAVAVLPHSKQDLCVICIQTKEGSLEQATREDGFLLEAKASWMA